MTHFFTRSQELVERTMFRGNIDGYTTVMTIHDGPGVDFAAFKCSSEKYDVLEDPIYMFFPFVLRHIFSSSVWANLDGWDALGLYNLEKGAVLIVLRSLPGHVAEMFYAIRPALSLQ